MRQNCEVDALFAQIVEVGFGDDANRLHRIAKVRERQDFENLFSCNVDGHADFEPLDFRCGRLRRGNEHVVRMNVSYRGREQRSCFFGERKRTLVTCEKLAVERPFECVNKAGSPSRIEIERLGRPGQAAFFTDSDKKPPGSDAASNVHSLKIPSCSF